MMHTCDRALVTQMPTGCHILKHRTAWKLPGSEAPAFVQSQARVEHTGHKAQSCARTPLWATSSHAGQRTYPIMRHTPYLQTGQRWQDQKADTAVSAFQQLR